MTNDEKYQHFSQIATEYLGKENELTSDKREIALIAFTEIEINSGGFLSFFEHSTTEIRQEIYQIYKKIGAIQCLDILQKFQSILDGFPKNIEFQDIDFDNPNFNKAGFDDIGELDEQYWEISEEVFILAYNYYIQPKDEKL
ncbi:DMP19 family protein [Moraxella oblonga]|uniref:DMP19 family protein n=1 Tax=Moraxella oblonga TaxID=200413 RepID=UPI00083674D6|nr:DUF4375 domain-containing protein [Moraxella oblonga]